MDREDIIKLAREQGLPETETEGVFIVNTDDLGRMLAAEREACATMCDDIRRMGGYSAQTPDWERGTGHCADAIRARGNT